MEKANFNWLMTEYENNTDRYIEAEKFIMELHNMNWLQRLFSSRKILKFLKSREKYYI